MSSFTEAQIWLIKLRITAFIRESIRAWLNEILGSNVRIHATQGLQERNIDTGLWHSVRISGAADHGARTLDQTGET